MNVQQLCGSIVLMIAAHALHVNGFIVLKVFQKCPKVSPQQNFNLNDYMGVWYATESFHAPYQAFSHCITATYSIKSSNEVNVLNQGLRGWRIGKWGWVWKEESKALGVATIRDLSQPGALNVAFGGSDEFFKSEGPNYIVADTDYKNYALVWSCVEFAGIFRIDTAWILSRTRNEPENTAGLKKTVKSWGVDPGHFNKIYQTFCD